MSAKTMSAVGLIAYVFTNLALAQTNDTGGVPAAAAPAAAPRPEYRAEQQQRAVVVEEKAYAPAQAAPAGSLSSATAAAKPQSSKKCTHMAELQDLKGEARDTFIKKCEARASASAHAAPKTADSDKAAEGSKPAAAPK